jgi:deazaflavin-dependent oxidoreductase (nitroreductase family)
MPSDRFYTRVSSAMPAGMLRAVGKLNVPLYRMTGGRLFGDLDGTPILLLTTTGRRSGEPRTAPVAYLRDGEQLIVIGSNAGNARAPAWALNLEASPDAEVELGRERRAVRARIAAGDQREDLWRKMTAGYSGFDDYAARTDRDIRLFVLEPR